MMQVTHRPPADYYFLNVRSMNAGQHKFVFLLRDPLYYVAVSKTGESDVQVWGDKGRSLMSHDHVAHHMYGY